MQQQPLPNFAYSKTGQQVVLEESGTNPWNLCHDLMQNHLS